MISIVMPCYNEEDNIPLIDKELFPALNKLKKKYEVIFIDDGSKDKTAEKIKKLMRKRKNIKFYQHKKNKGLGAAIRTAIPKCKGDLTVTLDSDLTFHPRQIPRLLKRYEKGDVDLVIGSPNLLEYDKSIQLYRILLSKCANLIYRIILGQKITSVSPIFRIYNSQYLKELKLESNKFEINAEILAKLLINKRRVAEVPARLTKRKYGESKLNNFKEIKNHIKLILKILYWRIK